MTAPHVFYNNLHLQFGSSRGKDKHSDQLEGHAQYLGVCELQPSKVKWI